MSEFGLVDSFGIDKNELDGLTPQECFCMGVEWQMFRAQLDFGEPFIAVCHFKNVDRLCDLAEKYGRFVESHFAVAGWCEIIVGNLKDA
jgi:hypothetical protein